MNQLVLYTGQLPQVGWCEIMLTCLLLHRCFNLLEIHPALFLEHSSNKDKGQQEDQPYRALESVEVGCYWKYNVMMFEFQ
jgi:hypothetical protein